MFRKRFGYSVILLAILAGTILASIPPHERVKEMIRKGLIQKPYFLQHFQELKERGLNVPWREVAKKQGININSPGSKNSTNAVNSSFKVLMIIVDFSDKPKTVSPTAFDAIGFGTTQGTLRHYYNTLSSGTLDIVTVNLPSAMGWKRMPQAYSYYVNGHGGEGTYPNNAQKLAEDACDAVDGVVNFNNYDNDGDGFVDGLVIVHAGPGAEYTGSDYDIWSHSWTMSSHKKHDDVYTYAYTMQPEYFQNPGDITCGVFAHECGHMIFGLPDLYDTDYSSEGLGNWSLMAGGSWNGPSGMGESPAYPDAWSRSQMQWKTAQFGTVQNINSNTVNQQIQSVENSSIVYKVWKYGTIGSEYFMIENRQQTGYDSYLPGNGLLIYHVDERNSGNDNEWYPGHTTYGHYNVALEQADGLYSLEKNSGRGDSGDPFPGSSNKLSFSSLTTPNSNDYNGNPTYVEVNNISNSASAMTADIYMGNVIVSQTLADNITQVGTVGRWNGSSFSPRLTPGQPISVVPGNNEILQGDQVICSNQKFYIWYKNFAKGTDVINHHGFTVGARDNNYNSRFSPIITNVTIQNLFEGSASINPSDNTVDFMDPWFINYNDPTYGNTLRNQGMSAPFLSRTSPFSPNTTTRYENNQPYNGVFINQTVSSGNFYSVRAPLKLTKNLGGTLGSREFYFQYWSSSNATLQQNGTNPTGFDQKAVVFNEDNAGITAYYKGLHLSNYSNAFANSFQKKTKSDGVNSLLVYESMNSIWMENSNNMGSSWTMMNDGKPINPVGTIAHDPSIDGTDDDCHFYVVGYAAPDPSANTTRIMASEVNGFSITGAKTLISNIPGSTFDAQPVVACLVVSKSQGTLSDKRAIMIWRQPAMTDDFAGTFPAGLYYKTGTLTQKPDSSNPYLTLNEITWEPYAFGTHIEGTDINSFNPTVAGVRDEANAIPMDFYLAFSQKTGSGGSWSVIKYTKLTLNSDGTVTVAPLVEISDPVDYGSYHQLNEKPSITLVNNLPCVAWKNYDDATYMQTAVLKRKVSSTSWSDTYNYAGKDDDATSVHVSNLGNLSIGYKNFVLGWSTSYSGNQFVRSTSLSTIYNSNTAEQNVQVMGGSRADFTDSYLISFNNASLPYYFQSSNAISLGTLAKASSEEGQGSTIESRSGLIKLNDVLLKASLGEVAFNDSKIGFKEPKENEERSYEHFQGSLETGDIDVNNSGSLSYSLGFDLSDSLKMASLLKDGGKIALQLELIDAGTKAVLKSLNSFVLTSSSIMKLKPQSYRLDLSGIGNRKVALRLSRELSLRDSLKAEYYVLRSYSIPRQAKKEKYVDLSYSEDTRVTEYAISQNYPNPFNPTTMITYQIPRASKVTLKVYDMLGKEVSTLVNGYKEMGKYSVEFNASSLPSGTYIYEIRANDFVKSGKMMLLK
ncbi:MAG: M6 family metalloprotease domain-containing protein [Ignavibacteria bacterium]|jgi:M6 family metalloprotease-like protein|nr:M6 family metalloprotease domain-containing protein [Ignavibacteria bacterium]MCU7503249.1 M6 family metalloprotease domain-containing protein [Ignavibacteria bacterium]MCU7515805.1 M6 family metalloprotease domain-containing protein [Ignavibacteria bacterium]